MQTYKVWDKRTNSETSARQLLAEGPEEAVELWAEEADSNGSFADGYPYGDDICVRDLATGKLYEVDLHTDFDPIFSTGPAVEVNERAAGDRA